MVDFCKTSNVNKEWKALGRQLVSLSNECIELQEERQICLHCHMESAIGVKGENPLFEFHHEDCEVGKSLELIATIRKRVKADKT